MTSMPVPDLGSRARYDRLVRSMTSCCPEFETCAIRGPKLAGKRIGPEEGSWHRRRPLVVTRRPNWCPLSINLWDSDTYAVLEAVGGPVKIHGERNPMQTGDARWLGPVLLRLA
jgi:hypothetical protein